MLNNAKREGYETKKVVCEMNESHKKTTKVRVRKKVTRIVISEWETRGQSQKQR